MSALSTFRTVSVRKVPLTSTAAWTFAGVLLGLICGRLAISHYGTAAIEGLVAAPVLVMISRRPLVAVVALLVLVSTVISYGALPLVRLPGHPPINLGDVCLAAAVGGTVWRRPWRMWPREVRRYFLALATFLLLLGVATVKTSLIGYTEARQALYEYRNFLYLGVALTIALELGTELWKPFLNFVVGLAAAVAVISIAAAISPSVAGVLSALGGSQGATNVEAVGSAVADTAVRVRVVGLYFVYSMGIPTLVMIVMVKDRWRPLRVAALLLILAAIAVSLNRNMYAGALVGLLVTAMLGGAGLRSRLGLGAAVVTMIIVLVTLTSVVPGLASKVGQRASTTLSPTGVLQSKSFQDRLYELRFALPEVGRHPVVGIGPNQPYGAFIVDSDGHKTPRLFVQNFYIYIATDYGIPAALAFLLIPGVCLLFGLARISHACAPLDKALLAGAIGTLVALMLSLLVGTYLQGPESTLAFGVSCGLLLAAALRTYSLSRLRGQNLHVRPS